MVAGLTGHNIIKAELGLIVQPHRASLFSNTYMLMASLFEIQESLRRE